MDVAALQLSIDSSDVVKAATDLGKFAEAAKKAGAATGNPNGSIAKLVATVQSMNSKLDIAIRTQNALSAAQSGAAKAADAAAAAQARATAETARAARAFANADAHVIAYRDHLARLAVANDNAAAGIRRTSAAMSDSAGAMRANTGNIAAQFQDIGVTAAMGMNPMMIALQQGTQLSAVFAATGGNAFKSLGSAILAVISPTSILTIGLVALVAAGLQMVDWASLAQSALMGLADILPTIATYGAAAGAALALAFAPALATAIWNVSIALTSGLIAGLGGIAGLAAGAVTALGAIPVALGLIVADLLIFSSEWEKAIGVRGTEIVRRAANYIIGSFVGAFHDVQFVWRNFPAIIGAAAIGATNAVIRSINFLLEKGAAAINGLIDMANTALSALGMGRIGNVAAPQLAEFANKAADGLAKAVSARNGQLQKDLTTDYIGAFGKAIGDAASWAQGKIRGFAGSLGAEAAAKAGRASASPSASAAAGAADKAAAASSAPVVVNPQWDLDLPKLDQIQPVETAMTRLYEGMKAARLEAKSFFTDWINGVRQGESVFKSFGDAVTNTLNRIIDQMIEQMLNQMLGIGSSGGIGSMGMNLTGGGPAGMLGGILGTFIGKGLTDLFGGLFATGGAFGTAQRFANGGAFTNSIVNTPTLFKFANGSKFGVMGEAGPEAVMPLMRGANGKLGVQAHGGGGTKINAPVTVQNDYHIQGAVTAPDIIALIRQGSAATQDEVKRQLGTWLQEYDRDGSVAI